MTSPRAPLRVLVVDDEPIARERLLALLAAESGVEVVGEAGDGRSAVAAIRRLAPDLLLLDVTMPDLDGFEVLARLGPQAPPETIFVTAYDRYAVRAFETHAVDYLLKPVERERFSVAIERARERLLLGKGRSGRLLELASSGSFGADGGGAEPPSPAPLTRLAVRSLGRVRFLRTAAIDWIEAADYYARLHVGDRSFLIRRSMKSLEESLDPRRFVRIHRSSIVNVERVREIRARLNGAYSVTLRDGTKVRLSRSRRRALQTLLAPH